VGGQKLRIGALGMTASIADSLASTGGICHEKVQQLDLFLPGLQDGCDDLSQGEWRWWRPIRLRGLGVGPSIASVHHSVIQ
jgi:hypothetical protein